MGEYIADNFKREAMKVPLLRELLMTDSVYIASNITFDNLAPLSTYLGKPGDPAKGGVPFAEYMRGRNSTAQAEIAATAGHRPVHPSGPQDLWLPNFVCDTSARSARWWTPDPADPVMRQLADTLLMVWIKGSEAHIRRNWCRRFDRAPKPMYYQPDFLHAMWEITAQPMGDRGKLSTPTTSCAGPMPARWPIASRAMPPWRAGA
jgi:hypothetical protein